jgi:hypothetical protein
MLRLTGLDLKLEQYRGGAFVATIAGPPAARARCAACGTARRPAPRGRDREPQRWLDRVIAPEAER